MSIPAHLHGLPPAVVRLKARQEREADRDMMRANESLLSEAIRAMRNEPEARLQ